MQNLITQIRKRSGEIVDFKKEKITNAIAKAIEAVGSPDQELAQKLSDEVIRIVSEKFHSRSIPAVEEIQDMVEDVLLDNKQVKAAKSFIIYRDQHRQLRDLNSTLDEEKLMQDYLGRADWRLKENSNMSFSVQGLNNY